MRNIKSKKLKYILSILLVVVFFGFLFLISEKEKEVENNQEGSEIVSVEKEIEEPEMVSLEICQISGNRTVFLDRGNKKYRIENEQSNITIKAVFNEGVFYSWNSENLDGKKFSLECMNSLNLEPAESSKEDEEKLYEDFSSFDDVVKESKSCKEYDKVASFSPPESIKFLDYCELLKNQMKLLKEM